MSEEQQNRESEEITMRPDASLAEAGSAALLKQLHKLRKNEAKAREGDPDGVHDMRVATRRLRAGLKVMEETVFEPEKCQKFRRKLRSLANALGATRDSDVFLEHLEQYSKTLPGEKLVGLEPLRLEINQRREEARQQMLRELDRKRTARLLDNLEKYLKAPDAAVRKDSGDENEATPVLVRHFAGSALWQGYEQVRAYETRLPDASVVVLHRLRVACKRLRYTLEFFEEALPQTAGSLISQLTEAQDKLGALHDQQVAQELIDQLTKKEPDNQALVDYAAFRQEEAGKIRAEFEGLWQNLSGPDFRRCLGSVLVGEEA